MDITLKKNSLNQLYEYFCVAQNSICICVRLRTFMIQLIGCKSSSFYLCSLSDSGWGLDIADNITSLYNMEEMPLPVSRNRFRTLYFPYLMQSWWCDLIQDIKKWYYNTDIWIRASDIAYFKRVDHRIITLASGTEITLPNSVNQVMTLI